VRHLKALIEEQNDHVEGLVRLGTLLMKRKEYGDAKANFAMAIKIQPRNVEILLNLGECCNKLKDLSGALEFYTRAVECAPSHWRGIYYF
jgi:cytochrome c-type biogenesis protein CcmH/NrfG